MRAGCILMRLTVAPGTYAPGNTSERLQRDRRNTGDRIRRTVVSSTPRVITTDDLADVFFGQTVKALAPGIRNLARERAAGKGRS